MRIAQNLEPPFRIDARKERVATIQETVEVQRAGQHDRQSERGCDCQRVRAGPRDEERRAAGERADDGTDNGQPGQRARVRRLGGADRQDGEVREGGAQRVQRASSFSATPASAKVRISRTIRAAASTNGSASAAPLPSPNRRRRSNSGSKPSAASAIA
jgi:hypothetical protein